MRRPYWPLVVCLLVGTAVNIGALAQQDSSATATDVEGHYAAPASKSVNLSLADEARFKQATRRVLCCCSSCPPTLLDECICATAREAKDVMRAKFLAGMTPEELVDDYIAQYGERFLAAPPKEGFNMVIWVFPAVAFVGLSLAFWYGIQRLTRRPDRAATEPKQEKAAADLERYGDEIERAVAERAKPSR